MGIFADKAELFDRYQATIQFRAQLRGGVPRDPKIIEGWLRSAAGVQQELELRHMMVRTLIELGADLDPEETDFDKIVEASSSMASVTKTQGFKRNGQGVYIEGRQIKAGIKESTHALFAGEKWGPTRKGPKGFVAEHVFVSPDAIALGRDEPDGIDTVIGHVTGPGGPRATLGYVEFVNAPTIEFEVLVDKVAGKHVATESWHKLWTHMEENGLGAMRSQGHGRFDLTGWEKLN